MKIWLLKKTIKAVRNYRDRFVKQSPGWENANITLLELEKELKFLQRQRELQSKPTPKARFTL